MPHALPRNQSIEYLERIMPSQKAQGLVAQIGFETHVQTMGGSVARKLVPGCWIAARKSARFYAQRSCFFVEPLLVPAAELPRWLDGANKSSRSQRTWSALSRAGFEVLECVPTFDSEPYLVRVNWRSYRYDPTRDVIEFVDPSSYFEAWRARGRQAQGEGWSAEMKARIGDLGEEALTRIVLPQLFYQDFFKRRFRASPADPYDVDGFIVGDGGDFYPVEIKEKSTFDAGDVGDAIGIDTGRLLMMLRLVLPLNGNGRYVVREVDPGEGADRRFRDWLTIRLDEILMSATWNPIGGGRGMFGTNTQTVIVPRSAFKLLESGDFSEQSLHDHFSMSESAKIAARQFLSEATTPISASRQTTL